MDKYSIKYPVGQAFELPGSMVHSTYLSVGPYSHMTPQFYIEYQ